MLMFRLYKTEPRQNWVAIGSGRDYLISEFKIEATREQFEQMTEHVKYRPFLIEETDKSVKWRGYSSIIMPHSFTSSGFAYSGDYVTIGHWITAELAMQACRKREIQDALKKIG